MKVVTILLFISIILLVIGVPTWIHLICLAILFFAAIVYGVYIALLFAPLE